MDRSRSDFRRTISSLLGVVIISVLVVTAFSGPVAGHTGDDGSHHHDGRMGTHDGMGGWMFGGLGFLWMILWTVVLIGIPVALVYLLLTRRGATDGTNDEDALALLRRRYAQGEIDDEEFETRRAKLLAEQH
jgi:putative membrane protein